MGCWHGCLLVLWKNCLIFTNFTISVKTQTIRVVGALTKRPTAPLTVLQIQSFGKVSFLLVHTLVWPTLLHIITDMLTNICCILIHALLYGLQSLCVLQIFDIGHLTHLTRIFKKFSFCIQIVQPFDQFAQRCHSQMCA